MERSGWRLLASRKGISTALKVDAGQATERSGGKADQQRGMLQRSTLQPSTLQAPRQHQPKEMREIPPGYQATDWNDPVP